MVESLAVGLAVLSGADFVFEFVNPAYQALSPFRAMLGRPFEQVWPEAAELLLPILHRVLESGVPFEVADMRIDIRRAVGGPLEESYFSFACSRLPDFPGAVPALLAYVVDTTPLVRARREAEERAQRRKLLLAAEHGARVEAERERDRFELLVRFVAEVNEGGDLDAVVGRALPLGVSLLGADDGDLGLVEEGGSTVRTFVSARENGRVGEAAPLDGLPHFRAAAEAGQPVYLTGVDAEGGEAELLRAGGHGSCLILPLLREGVCFGFMTLFWREGTDRLGTRGEAFAKALADQSALAITRAWVLDAETAARAAAERLSRQQEVLSAVLAHDLRSPITAITATSRALLQRDGLDGRQLDALGRIADIAERMGGLVEELLDFARARQGGGIPVERKPARIEDVCARVIREQLDAHPGRQVELVLGGPADGLWDPSRLEQVLSNLVGNALDRAPAGEPVEVRTTGTEDELILTVRNGGPPIPPELLPSLFEPFRRGDRKGSIGLGLFIVSEIVRAHGGRITVTSAAVEGTCFTVHLPRRA